MEPRIPATPGGPSRQSSVVKHAEGASVTANIGNQPSRQRQDDTMKRGRTKMKRIILTTLAGLALLAGAASVFAETATVTIGGGTLSVTGANVTLAAVTLDGTDQNTTSTSNAWTAEDSRGTGLGWHATIAATDFTTDDVQRVDVGSSTAGDFTLTYDGQTTASIAFDASAAIVETAIEALSNVTAATVTGTGATSTPWIIRFDTDSGQNIMTATDSLTGGSSTIVLEFIDISVADQQFQISLQDGDIAVIAGNTKPTSSVTSLTDIADATVTFISAAEDTGMGSFTLDPNFDLEVRAEVYKGTYISTLTLAAVSGP